MCTGSAKETDGLVNEDFSIFLEVDGHSFVCLRALSITMAPINAGQFLQFD